MGTLGIVLISVYFVISIAIGLWASRKQTAEGFLLGDRKVGSFSTFTTIAATKIGGGFLLTIVAFAYLYGMGAFWYVAGVIIGFWFFYLFAQKRLKDEADSNQYYTLADYIFKTYGKTAGYLAALLTLFITSSILIVQLIGGSKALNEITGFSFNVSLILISLVILIYLVAGGFKAVIKTDLFQYIIIFVLAFVILFGFIGVWKINPVYLDVWGPGIGNIIAFIIFGIMTPFYQPEIYRRVYATKDKQTLKNGFIMSMTIYPLVILAMVLIGLVIRTHLPEADPEIAFVRGLIYLLPAAFLGIGGVLMFSAIMSSADTYVFTNSSIFLQDFVLRGRKVNKKQMVGYFRLVMIGIIVVSALASYFLRSVIISSYLWLATGIVLSTGVMASWFFRRISNLAMTLGFVFGLGSFFYVIATGSFTPLVVGYALVSTLAGLIIGSIISKFFIKNK